MNGTLYGFVLAAHVVSAFIGFGAVAVTGIYGARTKAARRPREDPALVRYFRPGRNWAELVLVLTPLLGLTLLFGGDRSAVGQVWPWTGLALWTVAVGAASSLAWPAERSLQRYFAGVPGGPDGAEALARACRRIELGTAVASVCFVAAFFVMFFQPA